jgi:predicted TIM-barrel fold metal-dependent hydrolase
MEKTSWLELRNALDEIPLVDTHEHFLPPTFLADGENTLLRILKNSYLAADCISAGMDPGWWQSGSIVYGEIDLEKQRRSMKEDLSKLWPYLQRAKHTGYARALMAGLKTLHGLEGELDANSWNAIASNVQQTYERGNWFDTVLERLKIRRVIWDAHFMVAAPQLWSARMIPDFHSDDFLDYPWAHPVGGKSAAENAKAWGVELNSLEDLLHAIDLGFERYRSLGARSTKIGVAYRRGLKFDAASKVEALAAFSALHRERNEGDVIVLGNYVVRHLIQRSIESNFVVQIHTGYQCGHLDQGRPTHLVNLFQEFPEAKFVLFHGGYPYADETGLLAKAFPNVCIDLCWMPLLSPSMTVDMLERWIDLVPHSKIMWGGDVWSVEECYGAAQLFRDALARAIWDLIEWGALREEDAHPLAARIMLQNAAELFEFENT